MRSSAKRALVIGALAVGLTVPAGAALAVGTGSAIPGPTSGSTASDDATTRPWQGRGGRGPCMGGAVSDEMQKLRAEHRADMQKLRRTGSWSDMQKLRKEHQRDMQRLWQSR